MLRPASTRAARLACYRQRHRTAELPCLLARQVESRGREPLALQLTTGFPIEDSFVAEIWNRHSLVLFERKICDKRAVRYDDDLAVLERTHMLRKIRILFDADHFVDKVERTVEPFGFPVRNRQRLEALIVRAFEDLQCGMRAERCNRIEFA